MVASEPVVNVTLYLVLVTLSKFTHSAQCYEPSLALYAGGHMGFEVCVCVCVREEEGWRCTLCLRT